MFLYKYLHTNPLVFCIEIVYVFYMDDSSRNNTKSIGRPKNTGNISRPLTDKEVRQLLGVCYGSNGHRNRSIIMLGLCGLRIGTVMNLLKSDIVDSVGKIKSSFVLDASREKSKRTHRYYTSRQAKIILQEYLESTELDFDGPLFPNRKGEHMKSSVGSRLISDLLKKAGIEDNSSHCLRKTFATKCYTEHNMGILEIQTLLNHSSADHCRRYIGNLTPNITKVMDSISF